MKNLILFFLIVIGSVSKAQTAADAKVMVAALPVIKQYGIYPLVVPPTYNDNAVATYYIYDKLSDEQRFMISLQDTGPQGKQGILGDAKTKFDMAKTAKDHTINKVSRLKIGTHGYVAHDNYAGLRRNYMFMCILKNRYVLTIFLNSDKIKNLDEFQDFLVDYISKIKDSGLPK